MKRPEYFLMEHGKSICLFRQVGCIVCKVARFQNDYVAKDFAKEFGFPLSRDLKERIIKGGER